jgi:hypothetical protein
MKVSERTIRKAASHAKLTNAAPDRAAFLSKRKTSHMTAT